MTELAIEPIQRRTELAQQVSSTLITLIERGDIPVNEKLPTEKVLGERFAVSRTVIREAISYIESMGLVERRRGSGTRVIQAHRIHTQPEQRIRYETVEDILHTLELRLTLEPDTAALAAERHDAEDRKAMIRAYRLFADSCDNGKPGSYEDAAFHITIARGAKNPVFLAVYLQLGQAMVARAHLMPMELNSIATKRYLELLKIEHEAILDAILSRDAQEAHDVMRQQLLRSLSTYNTYRR